MPENFLGLIPPLCYCAESTSYKAILWFKYISTSQNVNIQHARNVRKELNRLKLMVGMKIVVPLTNFTVLFFMDVQNVTLLIRLTR